MEPLQRLILGNVSDAARAGFFELTSIEMGAFASDLRDEWHAAAPGKSELKKYEDGCDLIRTQLDAAHRPQTALAGRPVRLTRVIPLSGLPSLPSLPRIPGAGVGYILPNCLANIGALSKSGLDTVQNLADAISANDEVKAISCVDGLRAEVRDSNPSLQVLAQKLVLPKKACWVGRPPNGLNLSAQHWRDRLGLIHLPFDEAKTRATGVGDLLVRLTFAVRLSKKPLPRINTHRFVGLSAQKSDLWMVRPTPIHGGNQRFVQRHAQDRTNRAAKYGRTIDLSSPAYESGERELILLFGDNAVLELRDLELLDGVPKRRSRDDEHLPFVNSIAARLAWV